MRQVRIALCGVHSTGKSSIISALMNRHRGHINAIDNIMRTLIAEGYPAGDRTTPETLKAYILKQFEAEDLVLRSNARLVVSDRILLDGIAYVRANLAANRGLEVWTKLELDHFLAIARRQCLWYDWIFYFPIEFPIVGDDVRSLDETYRSAVDRELQDLLRSVPIRVITISGTIDDRVQQIENWLTKSDMEP